MRKSKSIKEKEMKASYYKKEAFYFFIKFFTLMGFLLLLERWEPVNQKILLPFAKLIAKLSSFLLNLFGLKTVSESTLITSLQFTVDIDTGCTGTGPIIILSSAMFAFPSSWKSKGYGILLGVIILQAANLIRVVSLVYISVKYPRYFNEAHTFIWQMAIICLSLLLWMAWARGVKKE
jgi:exosortase H (IPTLxxWG-CTERM-specific)